jgi:MFS family permease
VAGGWRRAGVALQYPQFRLFWTGAVVSSIGTWMQNVTVPYVLYQLTHSGTWVGLAVVAQVVPSILVNPVSGSLADRFSRRNLLRVSQTVGGLAAAALAVLWSTGHRSPGSVLALVAISGTALMATQPAWQAIVTDLVPPEHLLNAVTLNSAQANAARAVGPAIGGVILGTLGPTWAFSINALSFLAVIAALTILRLPARTTARPEGHVLQQYREGIAFARRSTGLLTAYALTAVVCGLGYPAFQLATLFAEQVYDVGPGKYGLLTGAYGVGAVSGAVLLSLFGAERPRGQVLPVVLVVHTIGLLGVGLSGDFWLGMAMYALVGAGSLCAIATLNTSIQTASPQALRGRILALWILSYSASYPLGSVVQGSLANRFGPGATVTGAAVLLAGALVVLTLRPALARSLDGDPDVAVVDPIPATG